MARDLKRLMVRKRGRSRPQFKPNRAFKQDYDKIYRKNPLAANLYLLFCEMADSNREVRVTEQELIELMPECFKNVREYAL